MSRRLSPSSSYRPSTSQPVDPSRQPNMPPLAGLKRESWRPNQPSHASSSQAPSTGSQASESTSQVRQYSRNNVVPASTFRPAASPPPPRKSTYETSQPAMGGSSTFDTASTEGRGNTNGNGSFRSSRDKGGWRRKDADEDRRRDDGRKRDDDRRDRRREDERREGDRRRDSDRRDNRRRSPVKNHSARSERSPVASSSSRAPLPRRERDISPRARGSVRGRGRDSPDYGVGGERDRSRGRERSLSRERPRRHAESPKRPPSPDDRSLRSPSPPFEKKRRPSSPRPPEPKRPRARRSFSAESRHAGSPPPSPPVRPRPNVDNRWRLPPATADNEFSAPPQRKRSRSRPRGMSPRNRRVEPHEERLRRPSPPPPPPPLLQDEREDEPSLPIYQPQIRHEEPSPSAYPPRTRPGPVTPHPSTIFSRQATSNGNGFAPSSRDNAPYQAEPPSNGSSNGRVRISFGSTSPTKAGGLASLPPAKRAAVQQMFDTPLPPYVPEVQQPEADEDMDMDVEPLSDAEDLADKERRYNDHLNSIAPYIQAAFNQWMVQANSLSLHAFLVHYFGRNPTEYELQQVEHLSGMRARLNRDQDRLRKESGLRNDLSGHSSRSDMDNSDRRRSPPRQPNTYRSMSPRRDSGPNFIPVAQPKMRTVPQDPAPSPQSHTPQPPSVPPPRAPSQSPPRAAALPPPPPPLSSVQTIIPSPAPTTTTPSSVHSTSRSARSQHNVTGETYERLIQVGEGTYGKVWKARHVDSGTFVALKRIRMEGEKDGFPVTAMREIKLLQGLRHENVLRLQEMMVSSGSVYMVLDYMDHDLTGVLSHPEIKFTPAHLKSLNHQMLSGLEYLHRKSILHRDMKGSNILLNGKGELKLADFGLARFYHKSRKNDYTNRVITLWYRSPELLLGETVYGPEVDMWSAGCIMLELFVGRPVFQGQDDINQLEVIYNIMGTPKEDVWPEVKNLPWYELVKPKVIQESRFRDSFTKWLSPAALDLAEGLLRFNPCTRLSATDALHTPYFLSEEPKMEKPTQLEGCGEHHEMSVKQEKHRRRQEGK
ncbi:CTD kinase subunit alpha, partial [Tremellales sp. Uapishka_1]